MKKSLKILIATLIIVVQCAMFAGCSLLTTGVPGKSAYEIAVENGFEGTVEQWLESLRGENGKDGKDGKNGDGTSIDIGIQSVAAKALRAIVSVYAGYRDTMGNLSYSTGAGVIFRIDGQNAYIITNYHVVYEEGEGVNGISDEISLLTYGKEYSDYQINATFIGGSITKDIAVLLAKSSDLPQDMCAADIADSNQVALGEQIVAVGNPLGEGISSTSGIVSVDSENIEMTALNSSSENIEMRVIRIDASVNRGNSGGGLFNMRGELLGIVNAKIIQEGVEGVGYAIPSNVAIGIAESVINNSGKKGLLGVVVKIAEIQTVYNSVKDKVEILETIEVDSVNAGAAAYGVLKVGDKIVSVRCNNANQLTINRIFYLTDYLYNVKAGDTITFTVVRNGSTMDVSVTLNASNFTAV